MSEKLVERLRKLSAYACCLEAADLIEELQREEELTMNLVAGQGNILRDVANALHGGPLKNGWWSHHDLSEIALGMRLNCENLVGPVHEQIDRNQIRVWLEGLKQ